ncbi:hypothetical protein [Thiofilum flexile]|uniref:hypothetical protein n=1 Tax=Thiofilum flexile TaxID=125627 RepID=UPI000380A081|nr:hypothetical protein [Thiofilum flexile]
MQKTKLVAALLVTLGLLSACTQETQNQIGRSIQNWTGTNGVLEVYAGDKLAKRFLKVDKLTTASGTTSNSDRPFRFGYGVLDANLNGVADSNEKRVYFEISDYSTSYVFYENPN